MIGYLTRSAQLLHALDSDLERASLSALRGEPLSPHQMERVLEAQRAGLRIPAGMMLMLATYFEEMDQRLTEMDRKRPKSLRERLGHYLLSRGNASNTSARKSNRQ